MKKSKKFLSAICAVCMITVAAVPVFASSVPTELPIVTVEESETARILPEPVVADPNGPIGAEFPGADTSGADTRAVSISTDFTVKVGVSFYRSFDTGKIFADDHNAFNVVVSDVAGSSYRVLIKNGNGYSYTSDEYSGDCTFTTTTENVSGDDTYEVYIQNMGTEVLTGHVKISSYYAS